MKILVFEDNALNQRLIERRLNSWGCKTYITENPIYGLNLLQATAIDIVLMDLRMPIMSGFEVTQKIRKSTKKEVTEIPIIALTADFTIDDKNECEENGINDLPKINIKICKSGQIKIGDKGADSKLSNQKDLDKDWELYCF